MDDEHAARNVATYFNRKSNMLPFLRVAISLMRTIESAIKKAPTISLTHQIGIDKD